MVGGGVPLITPPRYQGDLRMKLLFIIWGLATFATLIAWAALKVASDEDDRMGLDPLYEHDRQTS